MNILRFEKNIIFFKKGVDKPASIVYNNVTVE